MRRIFSMLSRDAGLPADDICHAMYEDYHESAQNADDDA